MTLKLVIGENESGEEFSERVIEMAQNIPNDRERLEFLRDHAITGETWRLFANSVISLYLKGKIGFLK